MYEPTRSRPFAWNDVPRLHELASCRWTVDGPRGYMRIGDFYWTLRNTPRDDLVRHMQVWPGPDGRLVAVALLDPPDVCDVIVAPGAEPVFDEALDWLEAEHAIHGGGALAIVVPAGDRKRAEALRRRGYAPGHRGNMRFWIAMESSPASTPLPDGYSLRSVSTDADIERRVFVETTSFDGFNITGDDWRSMTRRLPGYRPDLDLIAVAPDGTGVSACTCWHDSATGCGELEAVGTSRAYQRMGIGKAVVTEGLRRLHQIGATQAVVQTTIDNTPAVALYRSCGFEVVAEDYGWTRRG